MDVETLTLTTNHAASSYGQPVLLLDGEAFGPADITPAGMTGGELVTTWAARFIREDHPARLAFLAPAMLAQLKTMLDLYHRNLLDAPGSIFTEPYWREVRALIRQAEEANQ